MSRPRQLPAPFATGVFAVRTAKGEDVPMSSLRGLHMPFRGVRSHLEPVTVAQRYAALALVGPEQVMLSHCSAAVVHGLPVPRGCEHTALHVTTGGPKIRRPGVVAHRGQRSAVVVGGVPVTCLAETWLDLAPFVGLDALVVLGDEVARRLGGTQRLAALTDRRVPGVRRAREALSWIRVGSKSAMETRSRVLFVRAGLPEPELNGDIHDRDGGWLATGDLLWREAEVVGEYLGAHHFRDYAQGDSDIVRRRDVERAGWSHVDFTKDDYYRRPRRLVLLHRLAGLLRCELDPHGLAEVAAAPGLPGGPLRPCGGA
ncbi:hypothetical protein ON003_13875 [Janibacter hoylei]|uniref:hypothetical protein n=1 Tax=Janibacter hoylei TaxID=364298 RepID=UPI0022372D09|nr:hypothetical protein [Janibacter hoylei]MCW4602573.1 hypothetical protein [Janibacter hoylei]